MALDTSPLRSPPAVLLLLAAGIFAAGIWGEMNADAAHPAARLIADVAAPTIRGLVPEALGRPETVFGAFAKLGGLVALTGLLLVVTRLRAAPGTPATLPAESPRGRPAALAAAAGGLTRLLRRDSAAALPPAPSVAAPAGRIVPRRPARPRDSAAA